MQHARCQAAQPAACAAIIPIDAQGHSTCLSDVLQCFCSTHDPKHAQPRPERVQKPQTNIAAPEQHDARTPERTRQSTLWRTRAQGPRPKEGWQVGTMRAAMARVQDAFAPGCAAA
jgi:hypothetical protein